MKVIFISYSSSDKETAEDVADVLARNGWDCFLAHRDIHAGEEYAERIVDAIDNAKAVVLIMSKLANDSQHVMREIERAVNCNLSIIVYFIEEVNLSKSMEYFVKTQQWIQKDEYQKERLLCGVQGILTKNQVETSINDALDLANANAIKDEKKKSPAILWVAGGVIVLLMLVIVGLIMKITKPTNADIVDTGTDGEAVIAEKDAENDASLSRFVGVQLGDEVTLGTYYGEPIVWRVLHMNDDGTAVLIAKDCVCLKAFDAPEGGKYNEYDGVDYWSYDNHLVYDPELNALIRGNNDWSLSNIRTWLNSDKEMVLYEDQAPARSALGEGYNYYDDEAGFLHEWSDDDIAQLVVTTVRTPANGLSDKADTYGYVETKDLVYLLSEKELDWFDEAGFFPYTGLTDVAYANDETKYLLSDQDYYDTDTVYWWLRDPVLTVPEGMGTRVLVVPMKNMLDDGILLTECDTAGNGIYGIRPAITVRIK